MPKGNKQNHTMRLQLWISFFLLLFVMTVRLLWPEGTLVLRNHLSPAEITQTQEAMQTMFMNLKSGMNAGDALTEFCIGIIENGTLY